MNYQDCIDVYNALSSIKTPSFSELKDVENKNDYIPSSKFLYVVAKNKGKLKSVIDALEETVKPEKEFIKYQEERDELNRKYASKDENKQPIKEKVFVNGQPMERYVIIGLENPGSDYEREFEKLREKHKDAIDQMKQKEEGYRSMLKQKAEDFEPFTISIEDIPKGLSSFAWDGLIHIIKLEDNEIQHKSPKKANKR